MVVARRIDDDVPSGGEISGADDIGIVTRASEKLVGAAAPCQNIIALAPVEIVISLAAGKLIAA